MQVEFVNGFSVAVELFWIDTDGRAQGLSVLEPGESTTYDTFAAHRFVVRDGTGTDIANYMAVGQAKQTWRIGEPGTP